jgi:hypothetical protein
VWQLCLHSVTQPYTTWSRGREQGGGLRSLLLVITPRSVQEADTSLQAGEKDTLYDQRNGVRCIKISPNGKHLASGDRAGNIRYRAKI